MQRRVFVLFFAAASSSASCLGGKMSEPGWPGDSQAWTLAVAEVIWAGVRGLGPTELRSSLEERVGCFW
jgi:hypothetical protein